MKTLTLSQVAAHIEALKHQYGDVPIVLWDLDTSQYFSMSADNFEVQRMADDSVRVSVGPNYYGDPKEPDPASRPL